MYTQYFFIENQLASAFSL